MIYIFEVLEDDHVDILIEALDKYGVNVGNRKVGVATNTKSSLASHKLVTYLSERGADVTSLIPRHPGRIEANSVFHESLIRFANEGENICYIPGRVIPNDNNWQSKLMLQYSNPTKPSCCKLGKGLKLLGPLMVNRQFFDDTVFQNLPFLAREWREALKHIFANGQLSDTTPFLTKREPSKEDETQPPAPEEEEELNGEEFSMTLKRKPRKVSK